MYYRLATIGIIGCLTRMCRRPTACIASAMVGSKGGLSSSATVRHASRRTFTRFGTVFLFIFVSRLFRSYKNIRSTYLRIVEFYMSSAQSQRNSKMKF